MNLDSVWERMSETGNIETVLFRGAVCCRMVAKLLMILFTWAAFSLSDASGEEILRYRAKLSSKDHFNSAGARLTKVEQILRQDRANYHK